MKHSFFSFSRSLIFFFASQSPTLNKRKTIVFHWYSDKYEIYWQVDIIMWFGLHNAWAGIWRFDWLSNMQIINCNFFRLNIKWTHAQILKKMRGFVQYQLSGENKRALHWQFSGFFIRFILYTISDDNVNLKIRNRQLRTANWRDTFEFWITSGD